MKAVIFDRDGVILDTESCSINSTTKALSDLGISISDEEKSWIAGRHPDSLEYKQYFLNKHDFSYEEFRKIQSKIYYKLFESTPLFDKTISLIKNLNKLKIPLALNTSSGKTSTLKVLARTNLEDVFDVIVTSEDYENRKPDPEAYLLTAKKLNLNPLDCVVIEDSNVGVESAKNAGMKCIAIPNEYTKTQDLSQADLITNSADEIDIDLLSCI